MSEKRIKKLNHNVLEVSIMKSIDIQFHHLHDDIQTKHNLTHTHTVLSAWNIHQTGQRGTTPCILNTRSFCLKISILLAARTSEH